MKHGVAFRKFSRTSSHRMLMLRNLVTSLFEHEQIKTTLPKARDTARLAEKMITLAKKGDKPALVRANAFILKPDILPKLFGAFAQRYAERPGGYTRIHKFGNRPGDNAPHAILELVDNPRDLRTEMTARAIGWEMLREKLKSHRPVSIINSGAEGVDELIAKERGLPFGAEGVLRPKTRWNLQKILRFRDQGAPLNVGQKAARHMDTLLATPAAFKSIEEATMVEVEKRSLSTPRVPLVLNRIGQKNPGDTRPVHELVQGDLGLPRPSRKDRVLTVDTLFRPRRKPAGLRR